MFLDVGPEFSWWLITVFLATPAVVLLTLPVIWLGRNWVTSLAWILFGLNGLLYMILYGYRDGVDSWLDLFFWIAPILSLLIGWFLRPRSAKQDGSTPGR